MRRLSFFFVCCLVWLLLLPRPLIIHRLRPCCTLRNTTIHILCVAPLALIRRSFLPHRRLCPAVSPTGTVFEQQPTMLKNKICVFCILLPIQLLCIPQCVCIVASTLVHTLDLIVNVTELRYIVFYQTSLCLQASQWPHSIWAVCIVVLSNPLPKHTCFLLIPHHTILENEHHTHA
jgi:hypothetical protein